MALVQSYCPHCGASMRPRDAQCDVCLKITPHRIDRSQGVLACAFVLMLGVVVAAWRLGVGA
ncbi:hypothetical protein [Oleiagrimonas sp. C23AA]|uniref:hypothetical protein n=1 Tax=Oleiagrimonas sp. C23AA TaxID=2719047 RepID=UPI001421749B|nr:hypothetical protein [Oleiagrimonas sp. C23AA]NII11947.1 hypothetical protein [Oleiagrimonas sp. C23AA]